MYVQGQPWLSEQSKSALTDRNMHAKTFLKVILEFCDFDILGTTTSFYEMLILKRCETESFWVYFDSVNISSFPSNCSDLIFKCYLAFPLCHS